MKTRALDNFLKNNEEFLSDESFSACLRSMCKEKGLGQALVIRSAQIDRTYGYQLFNGTRKPSRDKVIMLAFGMGLSVEEAQRLLRAGGKSALYPKLKRDAVIIHCLKSGCGLDNTQLRLSENGLSQLGIL